MSIALGHRETQRPRCREVRVPVSWLWVPVAAIWGSALVSLPAALPGPPPEAHAHEPTPWEQVAQRHGDFRTEEQILKGNRLIHAVWNEDEAEVHRALAAGADPDARHLDPCGLGYTALMDASGMGHEGLVGLLLTSGANPNLGYDGETPLGLAVREGHAGVARRLVAAGARAANP
jgi:hypothetical protein